MSQPASRSDSSRSSSSIVAEPSARASPPLGAPTREYASNDDQEHGARHYQVPPGVASGVEPALGGIVGIVVDDDLRPHGILLDEALRRGDIEVATKLARIFKLTPVAA